LEISYNLDDVEYIASQLINNINSRTLLFYGDMGVGKTTLIKALVKALGCNDEVSSPTFSIVNEYKLIDDKIYHFDLYRIKDIEEAYNFGIEDYLYSNNWVIIEWPELVESMFYEKFNKVSIEIESETQRNLILN